MSNLKPIGASWWPAPVTVGIVLGQDTVTQQLKAYIGPLREHRTLALMLGLQELPPGTVERPEDEPGLTPAEATQAAALADIRHILAHGGKFDVQTAISLIERFGFWYEPLQHPVSVAT